MALTPNQSISRVDHRLTQCSYGLVSFMVERKNSMRVFVKWYSSKESVANLEPEEITSDHGLVDCDPESDNLLFIAHQHVLSELNNENQQFTITDLK